MIEINCFLNGICKDENCDECNVHKEWEKLRKAYIIYRKQINNVIKEVEKKDIKK